MNLLIALLIFDGSLVAAPFHGDVPNAPAASRTVAEEKSSDAAQRRVPQTMVVTATAYNSIKRETSATPQHGAWGDRLRPGIKAIAVSRDLLRLGLTHGTEVKIQGLPGTYRVLDKMSARWHRKIDIYMGLDVKAARGWGTRRVRIWWRPAAKP